MSTMNSEEYVKSVYPEAKCSDHPVKIFWPGQGEELKYLVVFYPASSISAGQGDTKEEAWMKAAVRVVQDENIRLRKLLMEIGTKMDLPENLHSALIKEIGNNQI